MTATITAKMVADLRAQTGAGMSECKKALEEAQGSIEEAIKVLRERGILKAAKRADRTAAEGLVGVAVAPDASAASIVELNCETDFVARNDGFQKLVEDLAKAALSAKARTPEQLHPVPVGSTTAKEAINEILMRIGEKIDASRVDTLEGDVVSAYIHPPGKIGVLISAKGTNLTPAAKQAVGAALREVGMHIAAYAPRFLDDSSIDARTIETEREIAANIARGQGKKEEMIARIVDGKMKAFAAENCLVQQAFAKDESRTVAQYVADEAKKAGATAVLSGFVRVQVGAGAKAGAENN